MSGARLSLGRRVRADIGQDYRYAHCLRVARLAASLARRHGEDVRAARTAGLLHDLARLYPGERLIAECEHRNMAIDAFERANPIVLHARVSAQLARERYGTSDERVLSAIERHTLGAPQMSRLDAILYLADGLEPGRTFPERPALERVAYDDLHAAMRMLLASAAAYERGRGLTLAPLTLAAIDWYAAPGAGAASREEGPMEDRACRT